MTNATKDYDLVVIGTGSAGSTVAYTCRAAGWSVAIIDNQPYGGTCALRGCDPKKILVGAADLVDWSRRMAALGVTSQAKLDWPALMKFKKTFTDPVSANRLKGYADAGIETYQETARFVGPTTLVVGSNTLDAKHIVIAAGAQPAKLPIEGSDHLITSDQFLDLPSLPKRIVFVGGGYISFEFAHIAARAGAAVTILHSSDRPLAGFDQTMVQMLVASSRKVGIEIVLGQPVHKVEKHNRAFVVTTGEREFQADLVVHGAGRAPALDELDLIVGNVAREKRGVSVNQYLQSTTNPAVYAAGDAAATAGLPLTPMAGYEGGIVAANLLKGNHQKVEYPVQPSVVFTIPPLATVGLTEAQAKEQGLNFRVQTDDTTSWYSSRRVGTIKSGFKVIVEEETDRILGAHLFGPHADEVINIFALAIRFGHTAADLKHLTYAYPTSGSDIPYTV
ncbi:NAD(P)/FAD-dependent oxidoreductase [Candidatus Berkelbacteria bacterium]|nr:NAD(P)/FAD-dependent oxidoreductase [Candidatus Berkelbacteria bacterium]